VAKLPRKVQSFSPLLPSHVSAAATAATKSRKVEKATWGRGRGTGMGIGIGIQLETEKEVDIWYRITAYSTLHNRTPPSKVWTEVKLVICISPLPPARYQSPIPPPTAAATSIKTPARSLPGSLTTVGFPRSASSHMAACRGMEPKRGISCSAHAARRWVGEPKMGVRAEQEGQVKCDMFWRRPRI